MPGYDGTGPEGQGPMTGGGRGRCRGMRYCSNATTGMPGWMRAQKGMRAFGGYGRAVSADERSAQS